MKNRLLAFPLMTLLLTACVTINIYFPAAAAEEAARTIVRDVLQKSPDEAPPPPEKGKDRQSSLSDGPAGLYALGWLLDTLVAPAQAGQADININTAAISAVRASMQRRQAELAAFYRSGALGFDNAGGITLRDLAKVGLGERNRLKKLVADENADRTRLYREIASANRHPEWEADVRATFARVWREEALPGYWVQQPGGAWAQR